MNIFLFNKSLRLNDNTTLINQLLEYKSVIPIFIFTEQINLKKNQYASQNSIQFMIESLQELSEEIKEIYKGKLYFFHNDNLMTVLNSFDNIISIGTNFDYSPYAIRRQDNIEKFCKANNIKFIIYEDHLLNDILDGQTLKKDGKPYSIFTPFNNFCQKNLNVRKPNKFKNFKFNINKQLENNKYYIDDITTITDYNNPDIQVRGGRSFGLTILNNIKKSKYIDYSSQRDYFTYDTTFLSAYNHFGNVSIREVYWSIIKSSKELNNFTKKSNILSIKDLTKLTELFNKYGVKGLINQLYWRDFYYNLFYNNPHMLSGQIGDTNQPFKEKFNYIKWNYNKDHFEKWCNGITGIPLCDAGIRQLNKTGYMHNRLRMICSSVLCKLLLIPWQWGEKYFAQKLVDYDVIQNAAGWGWGCHGIDPNQIFRIFSPHIQSYKFDKECIYIKKYIPELKNIEPIKIHNWESLLNYYVPSIINYKEARNLALTELKRINKLTI